MLAVGTVNLKENLVDKQPSSLTVTRPVIWKSSATDTEYIVASNYTNMAALSTLGTNACRSEGYTLNSLQLIG
ncbi:hypothetical protein Ciccas_012330, partial [Cichlidogyrus casuarinus]